VGTSDEITEFPPHGSALAAGRQTLDDDAGSAVIPADPKVAQPAALGQVLWVGSFGTCLQTRARPARIPPRGLKSAGLVYRYHYLDPGRHIMKQIATAVIAIAVLLSSACSASQVINTGGATKCKDFTTQDEKKQNDEVRKMLKDKNGADPTDIEISATRLSALTYCQTLGKPDTKISEAPHG
jgi:acid stress chaperone HdeA